MATATNDKPLRLGDLPVVKTNILENARQFDKGVVGGYNGVFPLSTASKGGIYLLPSTGKFYVCETAYNGAQISAPNSNFVELSVWKNHDRLSNLIKFDNTSIKNIIFKTYDWYSPQDNDEPITIPIGIDFKNILMLSIGSTNGKMPHANIIRDNNIILGYNNYWLFPRNAGHGKIYAIFEI